LHLTSKVFSPRGHPGIYRTVTSLVPHATNVIFCAEKGAYSHLPLSPEEDAALRAQGVHHYPLRLGDLTRPTVIRRFLAGLRRRHGRPAAVIGHLGNNGWRAIPLAKRAGIPILTTFHGTDVTVDLNSEKFGWRYQRLRQAPAARWLTVAAHLAERLIAWGIAPEQVATHHLPVDLPPQRESERQRSSALRLALVGRMIPVKGHSVAFEALQRVLREHPDTTLTLYGDGPLEQDLRRDVANRGLERAVAFAGSIPAEKLRAALVDAHVVLQPSRIDAAGVVEGLPNSVLEAMATGLPVIGSLHGGIVDAVQHGTRRPSPTPSCASKPTRPCADNWGVPAACGSKRSSASRPAGAPSRPRSKPPGGTTRPCRADNGRRPGNAPSWGSTSPSPCVLGRSRSSWSGTGGSSEPSAEPRRAFTPRPRSPGHSGAPVARGGNTRPERSGAP
jgi:glycosyltransferase involved in cell wall biosynthesis